MGDVSDIIRIGQVSSVDPETCRARVAFDDLNDMVSADLPILQDNTVKAKTYHLPEVGEHVLCVFLPSGMQTGYIIGSYYTDGNMPKKTGAGIYYAEYEDGTVIEYDINTSTLTVDAAKDITIKTAGNINVQAAGAISIHSDTSITMSAPKIDIN